MRPRHAVVLAALVALAVTAPAAAISPRPPMPPDPPGGYQPGCADRHADYYGGSWWTSAHYRIRLNVSYCWFGSEITRCDRWRQIVQMDAPWFWQGWLDFQLIGGVGGASCGAWMQAHVQGVRPGYYDEHHYPWIQGVGQRTGGWNANAGR